MCIRYELYCNPSIIQCMGGRGAYDPHSSPSRGALNVALSLISISMVYKDASHQIWCFYHNLNNSDHFATLFTGLIQITSKLNLVFFLMLNSFTMYRRHDINTKLNLLLTWKSRQTICYLNIQTSFTEVH